MQNLWYYSKREFTVTRRHSSKCVNSTSRATLLTNFLQQTFSGLPKQRFYGGSTRYDSYSDLRHPYTFYAPSCHLIQVGHTEVILSRSIKSGMQQHDPNHAQPRTVLHNNFTTRTNQKSKSRLSTND
jgi:hypothetical protein